VQGPGATGFTGHERNAQEQETALEFAQCIRDNGVKDFPDPAPGEPFVDTNRIPSAATTGGMSILNAAMQKCRDSGRGVRGDGVQRVRAMAPGGFEATGRASPPIRAPPSRRTRTPAPDRWRAPSGYAIFTGFALSLSRSSGEGRMERNSGSGGYPYASDAYTTAIAIRAIESNHARRTLGLEPSL
jgi:hypothetical protein